MEWCTVDCPVCGGLLHSNIAGSGSLWPRSEFSLSFSVDETAADWTVYGTFRGGPLLSSAILFLEMTGVGVIACQSAAFLLPTHLPSCRGRESPAATHAG